MTKEQISIIDTYVSVLNLTDKYSYMCADALMKSLSVDNCSLCPLKGKIKPVNFPGNCLFGLNSRDKLKDSLYHEIMNYVQKTYPEYLI